MIENNRFDALKNLVDKVEKAKNKKRNIINSKSTGTLREREAHSVQSKETISLEDQ